MSETEHCTRSCPLLCHQVAKTAHLLAQTVRVDGTHVSAVVYSTSPVHLENVELGLGAKPRAGADLCWGGESVSPAGGGETHRQARAEPVLQNKLRPCWPEGGGTNKSLCGLPEEPSGASEEPD